MIIFFVLYQVLQILLLPLIVVYIAIRKLKNKPVFGKFSERVGLVPKTPTEKNVIWLHAVSVGEVISLQSLIEKIKKASRVEVNIFIFLFLTIYKTIMVRKRGLEPLRPCEHYPLKVACIPISPLPQKSIQKIIVAALKCNTAKRIL